MNSIYHNFIINSTKEEVFKAITEPIHLVNWWPLKCSGIPKLGQEYNFNFTDEYNWFGFVSKSIINESFHIKMTKSDPDWNSTTFGFELKEVPKGIYVEFSHENWQEQNQHFKYASFCWAILLNGLRNYLEKGIVIPFENRE